MQELDQQIKNNIESIIQQRYSAGVEALSAKKIINYITKKFKIDIDENSLSDIVSDIKHVESIVDGKIMLGSAETNEEESVSDEIHDNAVDQAVDNLTQESVADALKNLKTGLIVDSTRIKLDENDMYYPLHQGSIREKKKYIISTIVPKQNLNESLVKCKIDGTALYIELPINCFVK